MGSRSEYKSDLIRFKYGGNLADLYLMHLLSRFLESRPQRKPLGLLFLAGLSLLTSLLSPQACVIAQCKEWAIKHAPTHTTTSYIDPPATAYFNIINMASATTTVRFFQIVLVFLQLADMSTSHSIVWIVNGDCIHIRYNRGTKHRYRQLHRLPD